MVYQLPIPATGETWAARLERAYGRMSHQGYRWHYGLRGVIDRLLNLRTENHDREWVELILSFAAKRPKRRSARSK